MANQEELRGRNPPAPPPRKKLPGELHLEQQRQLLFEQVWLQAWQAVAAQSILRGNASLTDIDRAADHCLNQFKMRFYEEV